MAFLPLPGAVEIMEVCPRDGFQSVKEFIPTEHKVAIIDGLAETGISAMEVTSFVSPKAIPQMADAADVMAEFKRSGRERSRPSPSFPTSGEPRAPWPPALTG